MFVLAYTVQGWCDGFEAPEVGLTSRLWWFRWKIRCILIPGLPWKVCFCFLFSHNSWHQIVKKGMKMIIIPWTFQAINTCWFIFCDELCLKQIQFRDSEDRLKNETFHLQQKKTHKKKRRTSGGLGVTNVMPTLNSCPWNVKLSECSHLKSTVAWFFDTKSTFKVPNPKEQWTTQTSSYRNNSSGIPPEKKKQKRTRTVHLFMSLYGCFQK